MKTATALALVVFLMMNTQKVTAQAEGALERRLTEVRALFREDPGGYDAIFSDAFLKQVPTAQLNSIFSGYFKKMGACSSAVLTKKDGEWKGNYDLIFEKGYNAPSWIALDQSEPYKVNGFLIGNPVKMAGSMEEVIEDLKKLPGTTSLAVANLSGEKPQFLYMHNPDASMALGSTFKLYVLAALAKEMQAKKSAWLKTVSLKKEHRSLPSGMVQNWPEGMGVTLHTLAVLMISMSDNTATDELIMNVGRDKVEAVLAECGNRDPKRNIPFLTTGEMFKLKGSRDASLGREYVKLDEKGKRALLDKQVKAFSIQDVTPFGLPTMIDSVEWFASTRELCDLMNWMRLNIDKPGSKELRGILSVNRGLNISEEQWPYVGYKGGSEPGVLNFTFLLQSKNGEWYAVSGGWNNTKETLEDGKLEGLVTRIIQLLGVAKQ